MNDGWSAEIASDPTSGFELVVEISEGDSHRATIRRDTSGELRLIFYRSNGDAEIPVVWLRDVLERAERELPGAKLRS